MDDKCIDCQNETLQLYSDLKIKYENLLWWKEKLEEALDIKEELNKSLRDENEELKGRMNDYER